jgi:hypothetical protein
MTSLHKKLFLVVFRTVTTEVCECVIWHEAQVTGG